jgi:hypothetical protein
MAGVTPEVERQPDPLVAPTSIMLPHLLSQRDRCNPPYGAGSDRIQNRLLVFGDDRFRPSLPEARSASVKGFGRRPSEPARTATTGRHPKPFTIPVVRGTRWDQRWFSDLDVASSLCG